MAPELHGPTPNLERWGKPIEMYPPGIRPPKNNHPSGITLAPLVHVAFQQLTC